MKRFGTAPGDEIDLHVRLSETLVQIELVGLNGHLLNVFDTRLPKGRRVAAILESAGVADDSVNVIALRGGPHAVECTREPWNQCR